MRFIDTPGGTMVELDGHLMDPELVERAALRCRRLWQIGLCILRRKSASAHLRLAPSVGFCRRLWVSSSRATNSDQGVGDLARFSFSDPDEGFRYWPKDTAS